MHDLVRTVVVGIGGSERLGFVNLLPAEALTRKRQESDVLVSFSVHGGPDLLSPASPAKRLPVIVRLRAAAVAGAVPA